MRLVVEEPLPLKEILSTLERRLLLHLLERVLSLGSCVWLARSAVGLRHGSTPIEILVLILKDWHLVLI